MRKPSTRRTGTPSRSIRSPASTVVLEIQAKNDSGDGRCAAAARLRQMASPAARPTSPPASGQAPRSPAPEARGHEGERRGDPGDGRRLARARLEAEEPPAGVARHGVEARPVDGGAGRGTGSPVEPVLADDPAGAVVEGGLPGFVGSGPVAEGVRGEIAAVLVVADRLVDPRLRPDELVHRAGEAADTVVRYQGPAGTAVPTQPVAFLPVCPWT